MSAISCLSHHDLAVCNNGTIGICVVVEGSGYAGSISLSDGYAKTSCFVRIKPIDAAMGSIHEDLPGLFVFEGRAGATCFILGRSISRRMPLSSAHIALNSITSRSKIFKNLQQRYHLSPLSKG